MADDLVQLEDGEWMRIDRRLWDAMGRYKFNERELIVLKKIIRWTYGCVKKTTDKDKDQGRYCIIDKLEEAAEAMGLHHPALTTTLHSLQEKQVIYILPGNKPKVIVFNKYWHSWKVPLRSKYSIEADGNVITRNLNYSAIDEAMGEEAFKQMKETYQFDKGLNDSLRKAYRIDKEVTESLRKNDQKLNDSLRKKSVDAHDNKAKEALKDNIIKDNNNYDHNSDSEQEAPGIQTDLTIIQGAILQKWGGQLVQTPPVAHIAAAIQEYEGKDRILEAIKRIPKILKEADPMTLMTYIGKVAENPSWYRDSKKPERKEDKSKRLLEDALRVYEQILNDDSADREDESYKQVLAEAKQRLEKAEEEYNGRNGIA